MAGDPPPKIEPLPLVGVVVVVAAAAAGDPNAVPVPPNIEPPAPPKAEAAPVGAAAVPPNMDWPAAAPAVAGTPNGDAAGALDPRPMLPKEKAEAAAADAEAEEVKVASVVVLLATCPNTD